MKRPKFYLALLAIPAFFFGACTTPMPPPPVTVYEVRPTTVITRTAPRPTTPAPTKSASGGYSESAEGFRAVEKPSSYSP